MAVPRWKAALVIDLFRRDPRIGEAARSVGIGFCAARAIVAGAGFQIRRGRKRIFSPPRFPREARARALAMLQAGASLRAAGAAVGASHEAVSVWARKAGAAPRLSERRRAAARTKALALSRAGMSDPKVAAAVGFSVVSVNEWRREAGIPSSRETRRKAAESAAHERKLAPGARSAGDAGWPMGAPRSKRTTSFVFRCPNCADYRRFSADPVEEAKKSYRCGKCGTTGIEPAPWGRYRALKAAREAEARVEREKRRAEKKRAGAVTSAVAGPSAE